MNKNHPFKHLYIYHKFLLNTQNLTLISKTKNSTIKPIKKIYTLYSPNIIIILQNKSN